MQEVITFVIDQEEQRLDQWLTNKLPDMTRSAVSKLIAEGKVQAQGVKKLKAGSKLALGTQISVELPQMELDYCKPVAMPLDIIYEDDALLVINKPQGLVVHPAAGHYEDTLVNGLLHYCTELSDIGGEFRPGIVHRLDKDTAGLMLVAKNNFCHRYLSEQLAAHEVKRTYHALVWGQLEAGEGVIDAPIGRDKYNRQRMAISEEGKPAVTHFRVLEQWRRFAKVEYRLETGRTHQIRVHSKFIGNPVVGDSIYAPNRERFNQQGQALVAVAIEFNHPETGEDMQFSIPEPEWFTSLSEQLAEQ